MNKNSNTNSMNEDEKVWGSKIKAYFKSRKLINLHIINNKIAIINGNTNNWMSRIPTIDVLKPEFKELIGDTFELKTIEKFGSKEEATDYINKNHPDLLIYSDGNILLSDEAYNIVLAQVHPTKDSILLVYPSIYGFCATNDISVTQMEKALEDNSILSGYRWQSFYQYKCPVTVPDQLFQDPLNLGFTFLKKKHKRGKAKEVIRIDKQGNTKEYDSIREAWKDLGKGNTTNMRKYIENEKYYNGYLFKYK